MSTADDDSEDRARREALAAAHHSDERVRIARDAARDAARRYEELILLARQTRSSARAGLPASNDALSQVERSVKAYTRLLRHHSASPEDALVLVKSCVLGAHAGSAWQPDALRDRLAHWFVAAYYGE